MKVDYWKSLWCLQETRTIANFEVWTWSQYNVILEMSWLNVVDTKIACKHGEVHGRLSNGKLFKIKGERAQPKVPLIYVTQIERSLRKKQEVMNVATIGKF